MPLKYNLGEEILKGDRILLSREPGVIEFVADPSAHNPDVQWYVDEFGGGLMIAHERLGSVFIEEPQSEEDLEFISRSDDRET